MATPWRPKQGPGPLPPLGSFLGDSSSDSPVGSRGVGNGPRAAVEIPPQTSQCVLNSLTMWEVWVVPAAPLHDTAK